MNTEPTGLATTTSTSDASLCVEGSTRQLTHAEEVLMSALLDMVSEGAKLKGQLTSACVREMNDGDMGSLRFVGPEGRRMGHEVVAAKAEDADGVSLEISVNLDEQGKLFELDVWKVDFSPLMRLPKPGQVRLA